MKNSIRGMLLSVFTVIFAVCVTIFGLSLNIRANADATDYSKTENWFTADVDCKQVSDSENSFDFTTDNQLKQVLHFHKEALAYLVEQGYEAIRITYYGKNDAAINLAIAKDNNVTGWTNNNGAGSQDFDITSGSSLIIKANYAVADGIDGFNLTFKAVDYESPEEWFSDFNSNVTHKVVGENSIDFTRSSDGGVLSFKADALTRLVAKGYDLIRVTYIESNATSDTALDITKDNVCGNWTNGTKKSRDFDITQGDFSLYCAKSSIVTTFNLTFTLIDKDVSVVTYKIDGVEKAVEKIAWSAENLTAKMPAKEVENTEIIGYEYNGGFYPDLSAVYGVVTEKYFIEVNAVTLQLETVDGASIRMVGTAGLRFSSIVGKSAHVNSYGMILTVRKNVDTDAATNAVGIKNFTKDGLDNANLKYLETSSTDSEFKSYEENGNICFNIVLTDIVDSHLSWEYIARTYVVVSYDNNETGLVYSSVDFTNNARSATSVADAACASGDLTDTQTAFIEENYYSKKA